MVTKAMTAHGLSTKFLPLYFMILAFLYVSDYTRDTMFGIDPTDLFIASILFFGALIFMYEGFNNVPKKGTTIGTAGFVFFFLFAIANGVFAVSIYFDEYDPFTDSGDLNLILQVIIGVNVVMFLIQGIYEILLSKRFVVEREFQHF